MTALFESLLLMIICDIFSASILAYSLFSWVRKPVLDTLYWYFGVSGPCIYVVFAS